MTETQPSFWGRTVPRCTLKSSIVSIILIFLVLKTTQARDIVPEQQGRVRSPSLPAAFDRFPSVTDRAMLRYILEDFVLYLIKTAQD